MARTDMSQTPAQQPPADPGVDAPWRIADVERETGLGKDALRVWERRYGFPTPLRDAAGERLYTNEQLQRLKLIKRLLDAQHRPGQVVGLSLSALQSLTGRNESTGQTGGQRTSAPSKPHQGEPLLPDEAQWLDWLTNDEIVLVRQAVQQRILRMGLGPAIDELIAPLCKLVGLAWMRGEVTVYQEHLFSAMLWSALREAMAALDGPARPQTSAPKVLLTTTPNEQHGLGLLMAECHFALAGCERVFLGTATPLSDIVQAVQRLQIDVLALSFSAYPARKEVAENLRQLRQLLPEKTDIWVGGAGAQALGRLLPQGVLRVQRSGDIAAQVAAWRARRAPK